MMFSQFRTPAAGEYHTMRFPAIDKSTGSCRRLPLMRFAHYFAHADHSYLPVIKQGTLPVTMLIHILPLRSRWNSGAARRIPFNGQRATYFVPPKACRFSKSSGGGGNVRPAV
ncbi:hypothetical protein KCP69_17280 [Salmonella enterica subsp. enterica]|nr:hypothetical protein KCP69_17280 [Salmonella enterica subsp. enterica]